MKRKFSLFIVLVMVFIIIFQGVVFAQYDNDNNLDKQNTGKKVIVKFNDDNEDQEAKLKTKELKYLKKLNKKNIFVLEADESTIQALKQDKDIKFIEEDAEVNKLDDKVTWNVENIRATELHEQSYYGDGVNVAVFDTGIDLGNSELNVVGGVSFVDGVDSYDDDNGHGTAMAGILSAQENNEGLLGVAPRINLYSVKVLDSDGKGNYSNIIEGLQWAIENDIDIIAMSLGGTQYSGILKEAINEAYENNILVVAAAGNDGSADLLNYPASYEQVISVGAVDSNNKIASFSNRGKGLDLVAPGVDIETLGLDNSTVNITGTSAAVQHVAGVAAQLLSAKRELTNTQMRALLYKSATNLGSRKVYGWGIVDADAALQNIDSDLSMPEDYAPPMEYMPVDAGGDGEVSAQALIIDGDGQTITVGQSATVKLQFDVDHPQTIVTVTNEYTGTVTRNQTISVRGGVVTTYTVPSSAFPVDAIYTVRFHATDVDERWDTIFVIYVEEGAPPASDDYGDDFSDAKRISVGSTTSGRIETAGDVDYFRFTASSSGTYVIKTAGSSDTFGVLFDNSESYITDDDDSGTDSNFYIEEYLQSGTYYIEVSHYGSGTGSYSLSVTKKGAAPSDDHGNSTSAATNLPLNTNVSGVINYEGDKDFFKFTTQANGTHIIGTTSEIDTFGILYDSNGNQLTYDDDYSGDYDFRISYDLEAGKTYYIAVLHYGDNGTGDYTLKVVAPTPTLAITGGPTSTNITQNSAVVSWNTNLNSNSTVEYGTTTSLGLTKSDATLTTVHSVALTGLNPGVTYYYRVKSTANGVTATSAIYNFTTQALLEPDLIITDISWSPASPIEGNSITFSATVKNQGTAATPAGVIHGVRFFVDGTLVNWRATYTSSIAPGSSVVIAADAGTDGSTWRAAGGTHQITADIDQAGRIEESNENNNTRAESITISGRPDLVITDISWVPSGPTEGDGVVFSATVYNRGTVATPAGVTNAIRFTVDGQNVSWASGYTSSISAGGSVTLTANSGQYSGVYKWTAVRGTHTVKAYADDYGNISESNEANNDDYSESITVKGIPDLTIVRTSIPTTGYISTGEEVELSVDVQNKGFGESPASGFRVKFEISKQNSTTDPLVFYGSINRSISSNPYGVSWETIEADQIWTPYSSGDYRIVVSIDSDNDVYEMNEGNNTSQVIVKVVQDNNENENDSKDGATILSLGRLLWMSFPSKIHDQFDEDWYYVDITKDNVDLLIKLQSPGYETSGTADNKNYDIELIDADGNVLAVSIANYPDSSLEWIRYRVSEGRYYIRVFTKNTNDFSETKYYTIYTKTQSNDIRFGGEFIGWDFSGEGNMADATFGLDIKLGNGMNKTWGTINGQDITYSDLINGFSYKPGSTTVFKDSALEIWNSAPIEGAPSKIFTIDNSWWVNNTIRLANPGETDATAITYQGNSFKVVLNERKFSMSALGKAPALFKDKIDYANAIISHELGHALGLRDLYVNRYDGYTDLEGNLIDNTDKIMYGWHNLWNFKGSSFISGKDIEGLRRVQGWDGLTYDSQEERKISMLPSRYASASYFGIDANELYRDSYMIVKGKVTSVTDGYNAEDEFYYSTVTMDVDNYYKNLSDNSSGQITFLQDGNSQMPFINNTLMEVGDEYILFLRKTDSNKLIIMGGPQGRFDISDTGDGLVVQNHLQKNMEQELNSQGYYNELNGIKPLDAFEQEIISSIAKIPPKVSASTTPTPNGLGWFNSDVTVHFTAEDPLYGVESVSPDVVLMTEGSNQTVTGTAVNKAGNSASYTLSGINIDKTKPVISGKIIEQPNSKGWYNKDITVHFDASDTLSGIDSVSPDTVISSEVLNHSVAGIAADLAGNSNSYIIENINIDKTAPYISVSLEQSDWSNEGVAILPAITDEGGSQVDKAEYSWTKDDSTPQQWESYGGGYLKQESDGVWYLNIKVLDNASNETIKKYGPYKIDKTQPYIEAIPSEYSWTNTGIDILPVIKDENGSGIKSSQYVLVKEGNIPTIWNNYISGKVSAEDEGIWYLHLKAEDYAGNENTLRFGPYMIDRTAPTVSVTPENRDWDNTDISVTPIFGDEGGSQVAIKQYSWSKDEAAPSLWNESNAETISHGVDGTWYLYLRVVDAAGNETVGKYGVYKLDKTAPTTKAVPAGREWSSAGVSVQAEYNDIGGSELSEMQYGWSKDENAPTDWADYTGLEMTQSEEGSWYLYLRASDNAGNITVDRYGPYQIDRTAPVISVTVESRDWNNKDITVEPSYTDDNGSGISKALYAWTMDESAPGQWISYSSGDVVQAEEGIWYLHLRAVDKAGNETSDTYGPYKTDKTAPQTSVSVEERDWETSDVEVVPGYTDEGGSELDKLQYAWSLTEEVPSQWEDYTGDSLIQQEDGAWYLYLRAVDNAGNETVNSYGQYKVDKTAPEIKADPSEADWVNRDISVKPEINDMLSGVADMSYIWSDSESELEEWLEYNGEELSVGDTGIWYLHLRASDNVGNERTATFGPYRIDKIIPSVMADPESLEWTNQDAVVIPAYDDEGGSELGSAQYSWSKDESSPGTWEEYNGSDISQNKDGIWYLFLKAVDRALNEITSMSGPYKVDQTMPEITYEFNAEYTYGDTIRLEFEASDSLSGVSETYVNFYDERYENGDEVVLDRPGIHEIEMVAVDAAGNERKEIKEIEIIVPAEINIDPDVINLKNLDNGNGDLTVYIEFPEGLSVSDIELNTILMNDEVVPVTDDKYGYVDNPVSDYDDDGIDEFMIKFERDSLIDILAEGDNDISISGRTADYRFIWNGILEAKSPGKEK